MVPSSLKHQFLQKIHEPHLGIVKSKLLVKTLVYWPRYNSDVKAMCQECDQHRENQTMPANVPQLHVRADNQGEVYGCDIADIQGNQHLVIVDYRGVCTFEYQLSNLQSSIGIEALKSVFCDVGVPNKLITDNARYFTSEEFSEFMMKWNIIHVMSSPRYPQGDSHAEKAIQIVKSIYEKCHDIKMGLLLLKTMPITSGYDQKAPCDVFFQCQLKLNLSIFRSAQGTSASDHDR